jgi:hypothetical protein
MKACIELSTRKVADLTVVNAAPTLDVDWRNSEEFASCSSDRRILVCRLGESEPLMDFIGHKDEVNAIKWDPSGAPCWWGFIRLSRLSRTHHPGCPGLCS